MNFDRMRALLLEQAVRGMLVSQRDDEPAVNLQVVKRSLKAQKRSRHFS